ncbi:MAG: hypothetical protein E7467_02665 [Ruminococcaceae bacterium]|nr:hypothetical protein [Oscillospiraceae bacterium]
MNERISKLLSIKSLVTLATTAVFAALALCGQVASSEFLTVYTIIVGFYFGTQYERKEGQK